MTMVFLKRSETGKRWLNNEKSHEWKRVTNKKRVCTRCTLWTNFKSAHVWVFIKKGKIKKREGKGGGGEKSGNKNLGKECAKKGGKWKRRKRERDEKEEKKTDEGKEEDEWWGVRRRWIEMAKKGRVWRERAREKKGRLRVAI